LAKKGEMKRERERERDNTITGILLKNKYVQRNEKKLKISLLFKYNTTRRIRESEIFVYFYY